MNCLVALEKLRAEQRDYPKPSEATKETPQYKAGYREGWSHGVRASIDEVEENGCACTEGLMDSEDDY